MQNDKETVTRHYTVDYLSIANRDIFVTEDGSYATRYVYDASGRRISAEFDYAPGTKRGEAGENLQSDIAVSIGKVFYRTSILGSTLFAVDKDGNQIAHAIYDPWGMPLTETYTDSNYSGLENLNNFTGYTYDVTLNLYFAQNRFYDADTHRFTQEDIVKDGNNWYVYCGNEPIVLTDPCGLTPYDDLRSLKWDDFWSPIKRYTHNGEVYYSIRSIAESLNDDGKLHYEPYNKLKNVSTFIWDYNGSRVELTYNLNEVPRKQILWTTTPENNVIILGTAKTSNETFKLSLLYHNRRVYIKKDDILSIFFNAFGEAFPVSGGELLYEPSKWKDYSIKERTNCYAYALDMQNYADGKEFLTREQAANALASPVYFSCFICAGYKKEQVEYALQPGAYLGRELTYDIMRSSNRFYEFCYEDMVSNPAVDVIKITASSPIPAGYYRICLVDYIGSDMYSSDYHWYRQNPDGSWSHKPGDKSVICTDSKGKIIFDPEKADRGKYSEVVGYYAVKKNL